MNKASENKKPAQAEAAPERMPEMEYTTLRLCVISPIGVPNIRRQDVANTDPAQDPRLAELVESVRQHGVLEPIIVQLVDMSGSLSEWHYELIAGFRRYTAATIAELEKIPCCVYLSKLSDRQILEVQLSENLHRADLAPTEEADVYEKMKVKLGCTREEIALRVGKSAKHVGRYLRLLNLPHEIQERIDSGEITLAKAQLLCSLPEDVAGEVMNGWASHLLRFNTTAKEMRDAVLRHFMHDLSSEVPFDMAREYRDRDEDGVDNTIYPPCANCPKKNQVELFDSEEFAKGDRCLSAECFRAKEKIAEKEIKESRKSKEEEDSDYEKEDDDYEDEKENAMRRAENKARINYYVEKKLEAGFGSASDYMGVHGENSLRPGLCADIFNDLCEEHIGLSIEKIEESGDAESVLRAMVFCDIFDRATYCGNELADWIGCNECPDEVIEQARAKAAEDFEAANAEGAAGAST
jgi:ParB/RepB/Spo0J family partition protein